MVLQENFHLKKQLEGQSIQLSGIKEEKEQLKKGHDYLIDEVGFRNKQIQMNSNIEKSLLAIQETLSELQESVTNALSLSLTDCALAVQDTDNLERRVDLGVESKEIVSTMIQVLVSTMNQITKRAPSGQESDTAYCYSGIPSLPSGETPRERLCCLCKSLATNSPRSDFYQPVDSGISSEQVMTDSCLNWDSSVLANQQTIVPDTASVYHIQTEANQQVQDSPIGSTELKPKMSGETK